MHINCVFGGGGGGLYKILGSSYREYQNPAWTELERGGGGIIKP